MRRICGAAAAVAWVAAACAAATGEAGGGTVPDREEVGVKMIVRSESFEEGGAISPRHTCDGADTSPPLAWSGAPETTAAYVLICDDPDAPVGTWVHWVLYDLPARTVSLPEGVPSTETIAGGGTHGKNSWGRLGYGGPCPPSGTHRYFFRLYALDRPLGLRPGATRAEVDAAMRGRVLAEGALMGRYRRARG